MVTLDLLGHGRSDRPADPLVLLDDGLRRAGRRAARPPRRRAGRHRRHVAGRQRVARGGGAGARSGSRGLLLEMPVLDNALEAGIMAFAPLLLRRPLPAAHRLGPALGHPAGPARPRAVLGRDRARHLRPAGRHRWPPPCTASSSAGSRRRRRSGAPIEAPALVVGHPADPIHPAADAAMLAEEMPNATLRAGPQHPGVARRARAAQRRWRPTSRVVLATRPPRAPPRRRTPLTGQNGRVPLYRDEAVVLRTHKLGEADRIITLLTRQHGRVRAVARGRAAYDLALGLAARAVHPRRPPARRGPQPRHDHPGRDDRPLPRPARARLRPLHRPAP